MESNVVWILEGTGSLRKSTRPNRPENGAVDGVSGRHPCFQAAVATRRKVPRDVCLGDVQQGVQSC